MTKTALDIDRTKVAEVQRILGVSTMTAAIDAALDEVINAWKRERALELLMDTDIEILDAIDRE